MASSCKAERAQGRSDKHRWVFQSINRGLEGLSLPDQYGFYFKTEKQESETEQRTLNVMKEKGASQPRAPHRPVGLQPQQLTVCSP